MPVAGVTQTSEVAMNPVPAEDACPSTAVPRRQALAGAGVVLGAAVCAGTGIAPQAAAMPNTPDGIIVARTSDVPVGSGVVVGDVMVTQPSPGVFMGLSARCTHRGCALSGVANGTIFCPCHGAQFNLDGSVARGPARWPLAQRPVSVQGDAIVLD
jgi:Rieske Fe-S protein